MCVHGSSRMSEVPATKSSRQIAQVCWEKVRVKVWLEIGRRRFPTARWVGAVAWGRISERISERVSSCWSATRVRVDEEGLLLLSISVSVTFTPVPFDSSFAFSGVPFSFNTSTCSPSCPGYTYTGNADNIWGGTTSRLIPRYSKSISPDTSLRCNDSLLLFCTSRKMMNANTTMSTIAPKMARMKTHIPGASEDWSGSVHSCINQRHSSAKKGKWYVPKSIRAYNLAHSAIVCASLPFPCPPYCSS